MPLSEQNAEMQLYHTNIKYSVYIAFIVHAIWLAGFWWFEFNTMAAVNVVSCGVYILAYYLMKKRNYLICFFLVIIEVMAHAFVATMILGWGAGFHYYMVIVIYVMCFFPQFRRIKGIAFGITVVLYIVLYRFTVNMPPIENNIVAFFFPEANMIGSLCVIGLLGHIFRNNLDHMIQDLHSMNKQLEHMATTDTLTGLATRRKMYKLMSERMKIKESFYMMMIDIDHFKDINDQYGHAVGDTAIEHISDLISEKLQMKGFASRWGGEEFLAVAEVADDEKAGRLAEAIKQETNVNAVTHGEEPVPVTVSIGIAKWERGRDIEDVINEADRALYSAKQKGRNRTTIHKPVETQ